MFKNYLKVAFRSLMRRPAYALINILGLTTGVACCLLIYLYISNELGMDSFHEKKDRIYRVATDAFPPSGEPDYFAVSSRPIGDAIRTDYAEVESLVRMTRWSPVIKKNGEYFNDDVFYFAEPQFFDVFTFPFIDGDAASALNQINTLVITEEMQTKYFGTENALGKTITLNDTAEFTVTGIIKNVPANSHFTFDFLVSYETNLRMFPPNDDWLSLNSYVYLTLKENVDPVAFTAKVKTVLMDNFGEELLSFGFKGDVIVQPLKDIYLNSKRKAEVGVTGDIKYIYVFGLVGVFVLIIACINFMNLATARSVERAKEVGLRKVSGSGRGLLISQFLTESVILTLVSVLLSFFVILIALPFFNDVANKEISYFELFRSDTLLVILGITLVVGLAAGSYPAFALSSFKITDVIKGSFKSNPRGILLRKGLVVFQFAISIILMVVTAIAFRQFNYMQTQDLGFDKEQVLVLNAGGIPNDLMEQKYAAAKSELDRLDAVTSVAASSSVPGRGTAFLLTSLDGMAEDDVHGMNVLSVDNDFFKTYGINLQSGRAFKPDGSLDVRTSTIITGSVYKIASWKTAEEVLDKNLSFGGPNLKIIGVVDNFHYFSLKQPLSPIVFTYNPNQFNFFSCKIKAENVDATIAQLRANWEKLFPGYAFDYFFLNEDFKNQYEAEQNVIGIFTTFTTMANIIACLGLFGLAAYTVTQRTKEIGVRKVLGASVPQVVMLLSKDFTRLVLIAYVIALPLAYYLSEQWLKEFPYRIDTDYLIFGIAGVIAFTVAWLTVSYQSLKAARTNPVHSLKSE